MTAGFREERSGSGRERAALRLETVVLALLAVLPILPYLTALFARGVPRFDLSADLAQMEYDTRRVWAGETFLGLAGRFKWCHPGPLQFYFSAPFQKLFGTSSTGNFVAAWVISAAAGATSVAATRIYAGRAHALAVLFVVICWIGAYGNVAANPWVRVVVVLPLLAYFVLAALFARGASGAAIPAVFFGSLAGQTHVSTCPTVGVIGVLALGAFVVGARRRGPLPRRDRRLLAWAAGLLVLVFIPPLIDQLWGAHNMSKIVDFFRHRWEPYKSYEVAIRNWEIATGWLPDRLVNGRIADDTQIPMAVRWEPPPDRASRTDTIIALVHVVSIVAASIVARRRRDTASLALLAVGAIGNVLAIVAIRAIIGEIHYSLIFWSTAASSVAWMGVLSAFGSAVGEVVARKKMATRKLGYALVVGGLAFATAVTVVQRSWLARYPFAAGSDPAANPLRRKIYATLRETAAKDGSTPVIHMEGAWYMSMAMMLEYDKDAVDARLADVDLWGFAGARPAANTPNVRHFWFSDPAWPIPYVACLEKVAMHDEVSIYSAEADVTSCGASPAP